MMSPNPPVSLWPDPFCLGTATDLYELTMMAGFAASGIDRAPSTFELFVRKLPKARSYLIFAGLEQAVAALLDLRFSEEQVAGLRTWPIFARTAPAFFDGLLNFRFEGDIWAMPEGSVAFEGEPLLRVDGLLGQGQLAETLLLSMLGYPTSVASKASRIIEQARGQGGDRPWDSARARPRSGIPQRPSVLPRWLRRDQPRRGRPAAGHPVLRDDGSLVGPGVRGRNDRLCPVRLALPRCRDDPGRHL